MSKALTILKPTPPAIAVGTIFAVVLQAAAGAAEPDPRVPDYPTQEGSVLKTSADAKTKTGKDTTGEYVAFVSGFALRQGPVVATVFTLYQNTSVTIQAGFLLTDDDQRVSFSSDQRKGWRFPPGISFTLRKVKYAVDARGRLDPEGCGPVTLDDGGDFTLLGEHGVAKYKRTSEASDVLKMTAKREWAPEEGVAVEVDGIVMRAKGGRLRKVSSKTP
jgi:hypothetical protein